MVHVRSMYVGETFRSAGVTVYSAWKKNMGLIICSAWTKNSDLTFYSAWTWVCMCRCEGRGCDCLWCMCEECGWDCSQCGCDYLQWIEEVRGCYLWLFTVHGRRTWKTYVCVNIYSVHVRRDACSPVFHAGLRLDNPSFITVFGQMG
jgi:hypothetical protein